MRLLNVEFFFNAFWFSSFLGLSFKNQFHYKRISFHLHPVLHPFTLYYIRSAVVLLGLPAQSFSLFTILGLSAIAICDSTSTSLHDGRNSKYITTMFWTCQLFFVKCRRATCIIISGLKTRQTGYSIAVIAVEPADKISFVYNCMQPRLRGQYNGKWPITLVCVSRPLVTVITAIEGTVRLESALDLVKKMERVKERHWSNHSTKNHPEEISKNLHGMFCTNYYFIKFVGQTLIN